MATKKQMENLRTGKPFKAGAAETMRAAKSGGEASGAARRKRKAARQALSAMLAEDLPKTATTKQLIKQYGLEKSCDTSAQTVILTGMLIKAAAGDTRAAQFVFDLLGESADAKRADARLKLDKQRLDFMRDELDEKRNGGGELPIIIDNRRPDMEPANES